MGTLACNCDLFKIAGCQQREIVGAQTILVAGFFSEHGKASFQNLFCLWAVVGRGVAIGGHDLETETHGLTFVITPDR